MRVIYFSTDYGPHDQRFLAALARSRHEVHYLRLRRHPTMDPGVSPPAKVRIVNWTGIADTFRVWQIPRLVLELRRIVENVRPDLIHAGPIQSCSLVAVLSGFRPVLTMSWGFDLMQDAERGPLWRLATRYVLRRSSFFVSDAVVTRNRAVAYGMAPDRTAVFPWGVDLHRFHPVRRPDSDRRASERVSRIRTRKTHEASARKIVLLSNRSWEPRYGVDVLASAFVMAARQLPGSSLILLGGGSQDEAIRRILKKGQVLDRVQFGGKIKPTEMHKWYRKADLFISPSHIDGSSVSLMEAMASGTPVLVSDIPANREWVTDNANGWLFRDGDAQHLAERMVWAARRSSDLARLGRAARKTAETRADWGRNFKVLLRAYERAVAPVATSRTRTAVEPMRAPTRARAEQQQFGSRSESAGRRGGRTA